MVVRPECGLLPAVPRALRELRLGRQGASAHPAALPRHPHADGWRNNLQSRQASRRLRSYDRARIRPSQPRISGREPGLDHVLVMEITRNPDGKVCVTWSWTDAPPPSDLDRTPTPLTAPKRSANKKPRR